MNYELIYNKLISKARDRTLSSYTEEHHIIPSCLGGSDVKENLVNLTPEEHYLAHQLLVKIYPNNDDLIFAANMMTVGRPSNKRYGWLKRKYAEAMSKGQSGINNSQYGSMWITNGTDSKKISKESEIPEGWYAGRKTGIIPHNKGKKRSLEEKENISSKLKGRKLSTEHKIKIGKGHLERPHKVLYKNVSYRNIHHASKENGVSYMKMKELVSFID